MSCTPPNKPLEWSGRLQFCIHRDSILPATQGQRSKDQQEASCNPNFLDGDLGQETYLTQNKLRMESRELYSSRKDHDSVDIS